MNTSPTALAGVRVLDLSRVLAGPWATQILGDLGADVIKVEKPGAGDDTRSWGPPFTTTPNGERGDAAYYLAANRNKRSVAIDFAKPEGAALIKRLAPQCQVFVENFKTGGVKRYGLDYESIAALNPAIVYCSITGFGQTGPYAKRPGYDYMIQAMGGLMSLTGEPDGEPMKSAVAVADLFTGMYAVTAILAALRHAERTGEGQHLDISLLDCQIAMLANLGMNYLVSGEEPKRLGNAHASIAPYQVFATADGHVVLAVGNDGQFHDFCVAAGLTLADDPRFAHNAARVANRLALTDAIGAAMRQRPTAEWMGALEAAGVPCGPINTLPQVFADPHVIARQAVHTMTREKGAEVRLTANPIRMSKTPPRADHAPPALGADTDAILATLLNADEMELRALRETGVI
ncbi:CaiB/BaiF CoA transferase family protein [Terricaulis silvestris]|uniref:Formyl-coenzyme A transferase n=1 Tax=Terricaulis silvestris TaxID=2686094 RepID=A0A6I6MPF7_9CAUL|nr:CaiB/BaiF CoA-transferase family protein [Terricaulis silvestris]QGZ95258.1 Formyl-coenzyme A transferase [Terricaulis silvestris]